MRPHSHQRESSEIHFFVRAPESYIVCWFLYLSLEFRGTTRCPLGQKYLLNWPPGLGPESIKMIT